MIETKNSIYTFHVILLSILLILTNSCKKEAKDQVPGLITASLSDIKHNTATCGGNITSDGGSAITARGVCWSQTSNPTLSNSLTTDGSGIGIFNSALTGLIPNTRYYVRAYATNASGTGYGNSLVFATAAPTIPSLTTAAISNIKQTEATSGGNIASDGGSAIKARGICWSTLSTPTIADSKTSDGTGTGVFSGTLSGLNANTQYYVRAFATNSTGTGYGTTISFTTSEPELPALTTLNITEIDISTALCGGTITSDGGSAITTCGVCWCISPAIPTIADNKTTDGAGLGEFKSVITGLTANGIYYNARAYAINSKGISYGTTRGFKALSTPSIWTTTIWGITPISAKSGGDVIDGGTQVTAKGVCWHTSENPTTDLNTKTNDGTGAAQFTSSIEGLTINNTYYVRAYATNKVGTTYGANMTFSTGNGAAYLGGLIGYIFEPGDPGYVEGETHGLIVAPGSQYSRAGWGCSGTISGGANGTALGTGKQNTLDIVSGCATPDIAARICYDLILGGYDDWFLPSKDELEKILRNPAKNTYLNTSEWYWSSTQYSATEAWFSEIFIGSRFFYKDQLNTVRAIRAF